MLPQKNTTIQELVDKRDKHRLKIRKKQLNDMFQKKRQLHDQEEVETAKQPTSDELAQTYIGLRESEDQKMEHLNNLVRIRHTYDHDYSSWLESGLMDYLITIVTDDDYDFECRSVTAQLLSNIVNKFRKNNVAIQHRLVNILLEHKLPQQIVASLDAKTINQDYFQYMQNFIYLCSNMMADSYQLRMPMIRSGVVSVCLKMYKESESDKTDDLVCWLAANIVSVPLNQSDGNPPTYEDVCHLIPIFNHFVSQKNMALMCLYGMHDMLKGNEAVKTDVIINYIGHSDIRISIASMKLMRRIVNRESDSVVLFDRMNIVMGRMKLTSIEYGQVCRLTAWIVRQTGRDTLLGHPIWPMISDYAMKEQQLDSSLVDIMVLYYQLLSHMTMPEMESAIRDSSVRWVIQQGIDMGDSEAILMALSLLQCIVKVYKQEHMWRKIESTAGQYEERLMRMLQHPVEEVRQTSASLLDIIQQNISQVE